MNARAHATSQKVLEVHYKGKNIHEVLNLTIREGLQFFADVPRLTEKLRVLDEVGLGYLRFGQSATTLSGGEAQRMKLAAHLQTGGRARHHSEGGSVTNASAACFTFSTSPPPACTSTT